MYRTESGKVAIQCRLWWKWGAATLLCAAQLGCAHRHSSGERANMLPPRDWLGLSECSGDPGAAPQIEPGQDVIVLVHGCNSSAAKFTNLSQVFAFHGQKAICFSYDYRDSLLSSARELRRSLNSLQAESEVGELKVVGHSQGGLVARAALVDVEPEDSIPAPEVAELITVSTPFSGIRSAKDCGMIGLHIVSFGITVGVCHAIAGRKWTEIYPKAPFITQPGRLSPTVGAHFLIATDERDTCLRFKGSECVDSDFIFSLQEQEGGPVLNQRTSGEVVKAGHTEIVGEGGMAPVKLVDVLQRRGVMRSTLERKREALGRLMARIY